MLISKKSFSDFEHELNIPKPISNSKFYLEKVEQGIVKPAQKLSKQLEHHNDEL